LIGESSLSRKSGKLLTGFPFTRETLDYPVKPDNDRHIETKQPCSKLTGNVKFEGVYMTSFKDRIIRAAKLDVHLYEEVEADTGALGQAMTVVILSSLAAGIGTFQHGGLSGIFIGTIGALIGWYIWAYLTYFIGTKILPEQQTSSTTGELLRTVGFSSSPGLIRVLGIIPGITQIVMFGASVWMLVAMVIAVRQALDYKSTLRAVGVCIIGWIIQVLFLAMLFFLFGKGIKSL